MMQNLRYIGRDEMYEYAATRADFVDVYGDPSGRKTNSDTWTSFGVGSEICHPDGTLNIRGGYITVGLYSTDTFQYAKLYTMRDSVERILANLGEVMWDEPEADKKNWHLWVRRDVDFSGDMNGSLSVDDGRAARHAQCV